MKGNFHTHTHRCNHASGDVSDYVHCAIEAGLAVLGISDHTPLPGDRWPGDRMKLAELDDYTGKIETAQQENVDVITILKAMECDSHPDHMDFFRRELLEARGYDYLIASTHYIDWKGERLHAAMLTEEEQIGAYKDLVIYGIEQKVFAFVGHPDFFAVTLHEMTPRVEGYCREIFQAAAEYSIPLEINGSGLRRKMPTYPWRPFWELGKEFDIRVICNSDAHLPEDVGDIDEAIALAEGFGFDICRPLSGNGVRNPFPRNPLSLP